MRYMDQPTPSSCLRKVSRRGHGTLDWSRRGGAGCGWWYWHSLVIFAFFSSFSSGLLPVSCGRGAVQCCSSAVVQWYFGDADWVCLVFEMVDGGWWRRGVWICREEAWVCSGEGENCHCQRLPSRDCQRGKRLPGYLDLGIWVPVAVERGARNEKRTGVGAG